MQSEYTKFWSIKLHANFNKTLRLMICTKCSLCECVYAKRSVLYYLVISASMCCVKHNLVISTGMHKVLHNLVITAGMRKVQHNLVISAGMHKGQHNLMISASIRKVQHSLWISASIRKVQCISRISIKKFATKFEIITGLGHSDSWKN